MSFADSSIPSEAFLCDIAKLTTFCRTSAENGFSMKSKAPNFIACTAFSIVPKAVIIIIGEDVLDFAFCRNSSPSIFGIFKSLIITSKLSFSRVFNASTAFFTECVSYFRCFRAAESAALICSSSSTIKTLYIFFCHLYGFYGIFGIEIRTYFFCKLLGRCCPANHYFNPQTLFFNFVDNRFHIYHSCCH